MMMLGAEVAKAAAEAPPRPRHEGLRQDAPALEVRDLAYGHALSARVLSLERGEILGVAALEGQGQQELFDCIAGVRRATAGEIRANGRALELRHPADAIRAGLVLVPANRLHALLPQRSIRENVALASFGRFGAWGPIAMRAERKRVDSAVERLQIDRVLPRK